MSLFDSGAREGEENDTEKYDEFDLEDVDKISEEIENKRLKYILNDFFTMYFIYY
jgi:hypothetical protein